MTSLVKRCGVMPEPDGNQSGTVAGPIGSGEGLPQRGTPPAEPTTGTTTTTTSNPYAMTDAELLDALGPSWSEVARHRRDFHPGYRSAA